MSIVCRNLSTGYGSTVIGSAIGLEARAGDIVCLLGPNGCGKTTLFKTILGLVPALSGDVEIAGRSLGTLSRKELARTIAYVPQQHAPPFPFQVLEVVLMGRTPRLGTFAQPSRLDREKAMEALCQIGMEDFASRDYSRLSGGQRQLVLIARALAQEAPVMVMDEPTASLDFGNRMRVLEKISELCARRSSTSPVSGSDRSVILSTHDPDQAFLLGARVVLLKNGTIHAEGAPEDILTGPLLSDVYGTPVIVETTESGRRVCLPPLSRQSTATITSDTVRVHPLGNARSAETG